MQLNRSTDYAIQMLVYLAKAERPYPPRSWQQLSTYLIAICSRSVRS